MSDIRFNQWLHQSGTGGVSQDHIGNIGIGTTNPSIVVSAANTAVLNVGVITANNLFVNNAFNGDITGNVTGNISGATGTFSGNIDIADKIIHTGDTDTAMRFPADNTFAVDTGGSERFKVTDSLKEVKNGNLRITSTYIDFSGDISTPTTAAAIFRPADNTLAFSTGNNERLRITSDGKVGVNETAPAADLVVKQSGNTFTTQSQTVALFQRSSTAGHGAKIAIVGGTGGSSDINFGDTDDEDIGIIQYYHTDDSFRFTTNTSEKLRIDTSGRLLLNSGTDVRIELGTTGSTGTNNRNHLRGDGTNMKYNCCAGGGHFFEANGGERMRIDSGGRVNIGDAHLTQTSSFLHVGRSSGGTAAGESVIAATLGDYSTMVSALLTVKNAGNRGAQGATGGSPLAKFEFNNGTAFEIDKNGYRTLPYQPCAMAYNAQGQHMAGAAVAQFNSTRFNIGNMYNSSNGRMTVPVAGRYLVAYSGLHDYISQNAIGFDIRINGSNFNGGEGYQEDSSRGNSQLSKTLILSLSANDYVEIYIRQSGTQVHQRYGSFSMCLLT